SLSGTWNGQISIDSDSVIILDGVTVKCTVAPAMLFNDNLTEYGDNSESSVASTYKTLGEDLIGTLIDNNSSLVIIGSNSENNITGANVYRILKPTPKSSATKVDGKDISDQKKLYKMDGAFYSHVSLGISGEGDGNGILNVTSSTLEGLGSELHMTVDGGTINVTAPDDGINVNEDNVSVFTMLSGNLTISSTKGDGIDSNGYVVINGGTLNITAGNSSQSSAGEAGIDAEKDIYIDSSATYNWTSATGSNNAPFSGNNENENNTPPTPPSESQNQSNSTNTNTNSNTTTTTTTTNTDSTNYYTDNTGNTSGTTGTTTNNNTYIPNIVASSDYTVDNNNNVNDNYNYQDNYDVAALINAQTSTSRGTTKIQMATGVDFSMLSEDQQYYLPRTVPTSGNVFTLERKVNEFSAIVIGR
ncbi:MAG: carbohydrate-binding domain-containing protein, partial [Synergistaceae bacterium]|nr:carbohydrate-binding domain-containing protein [Synergistaceae bacterium]